MGGEKEARGGRGSHITRVKEGPRFSIGDIDQRGNEEGVKSGVLGGEKNKKDLGERKSDKTAYTFVRNKKSLNALWVPE